MTEDEKLECLAWLDALRARVVAGETETVFLVEFRTGPGGIATKHLGVEQAAQTMHSIGIGIMQSAVDALFEDGGEEPVRLEAFDPSPGN